MANRWLSFSQKELDLLEEGVLMLGEAGWDDEMRKLHRRLVRARKPIKTASAKGKGRELQRWVAQRLSDILDIPFDQQDDESLIRYREMGQAGTDVILRGEAFTLFPFSVECKSTESFDLRKSVEQAKANVREGSWWMLVHRTKRLPGHTLVIVDWETFIAWGRGDDPPG